jgi:broad specificity phosphatase PhoE
LTALTRVFLLRHGESADPTVFHGAESDVGLSERGRRQAEAVAPILAARGPVAVVSSGMRRALETAAPIAAACGCPVRAEPDLHERRVGALSGTAFASPDGVWPETLRRWMAGETSYAPPGAESFDDVRGRVLPVWERLAEEYEGRCVVVVAHGVVCRALFVSLLPGFSVGDWQRLGPVRNVGVSELLRRDGRWQAVRLNEVHEAVALA